MNLVPLRFDIFRDYQQRHLLYENETFSCFRNNFNIHFGKHGKQDKKYLEFINNIMNTTKDHQEVFSIINSYKNIAVSWLTLKNDFFVNSLDKFILECHQHGIGEHFRNLFSSLYESKPSPKKPNVLTMQMLSAGFYIWLAVVGIACIVFVFEHIVFCFTKNQTKKPVHKTRKTHNKKTKEDKNS
jgi:hypothetical protein